MNLTISGHHLDVSPALRNYVMDKLQRVLRHFDQVIDVKVLLSVHNESEKEKRQRAECCVYVKGNELYAGSSHLNLYAAVDALIDKLDRKVVKHKTRLKERRGETIKRDVTALAAV